MTVLHVLPKANKELAKGNPVVLLNEGSCSGAVSKTSMAHNDSQGTMQQTSGCDRKGKGMHGLIVVRKLLADKEIGECLKMTMNLNCNFLEHPAEEKINAFYYRGLYITKCTQVALRIFIFCGLIYGCLKVK